MTVLKLAIRNITSKPWRTVATIFAIAVAVAMIFTMLSFRFAVYDYIYSSETAISGSSDILISTNSSSDRITQVSEPLYSMGEIECITPSLSLYALLGGEYVQVRGFEKGHIDELQHIDVVELRSGLSSIADLRPDDVVVSEGFAKHFGLQVGDRIDLALGSNSAPFIIGGISKGNGYFTDDAPYLVVGHITDGAARLLASVALRDVCNEIYIKLADGADVQGVIDKISIIEPYSSMLVRAMGEDGYISEQVDSMTAPVVLAGAAVLALSIVIIFLLFMMSEQEKVSLISRLRIIGATRGQLLALFMAESSMLSLAGALLGVGVAAGIYTLMLKLTLGSAISLAISPAMLIAAMAIGFLSGTLSSAAPIVRALNGTIRSNQLDLNKRGALGYILPVATSIISIALTVTLAAVDFTGAGVGILAVITLVMLLIMTGTIASPAMRLSARISDKCGAIVASRELIRVKRHARSSTLLTLGMAVSMLLFMAWSLTNAIFTSYVQDFSQMIFVNNIQASADIEDFSGVDGVKFASKIVWQQGEIGDTRFDKTVNILGTVHAFELADFKFITDEKTVKERILSDEPYVFVDLALQKLYGVKEGDVLELTIDSGKKNVKVGGILSHRLFNGGYIVMSEGVIEELYGIKTDMAVILADDVDAVADSLRVRFASKNYYVVKTLDAYKWDMQSTQAVFDLVGTLAIAVAAFILIVAVASTLVGRATEAKSRTALLNVGMSKNMLLASEITEHTCIAVTAFVVAFIMSIPLTFALIKALRLFGLYFEFMYEVRAVAATGAVMCAIFSLVPLIFRFRKGYEISVKKAR